MLTEMYVTNLITIENLHLEFFAGTTIISGETGTGKSILIDAIELALGNRASEQMIRPGAEKAEISLCFDLTKLPDAKKWLKQHDLNQHENDCIIRRNIGKDGRSRSFINGSPVTLQFIRELSEFIINIHGQHEHQTLLKQEKQRDILDHYAKHQSLTHEVAELASQWRQTRDKLDSLQKSTEENNRRREFLAFQYKEIEALQLTDQEFSQLDSDHKQLAHADELQNNVKLALESLALNEDFNITRSTQQILHNLTLVQQIDPKIATWVESIQSLLIQLNDLETEFQHYLDKIDLDPARLAVIEQRLSALFNLARKHKIKPEELFSFQQQMAAELNQLENTDEVCAELLQQLAAIEEKYFATAKKLSQSRLKSSKKLTAEINKIIHTLALPRAEFHIHLEQETTPRISTHGLEKIIFQIKTNEGQPLQALNKVASGGELSRISLAIHVATAEQHTIPTLIFDEVDTGISGGTAEVVGKLLRHLGETHQILCITHLPQVAAQGHHHLRVEKIQLNQVTQTKISNLSPKEKIDEIARMLGGIEITKTTLAHAREMLETTA